MNGYKGTNSIDKQMFLFCITFFGVQAAVVVTQSFYVAYMDSMGVPSTFTGIGSSIMAGFGIMGQFVISYWCDRKKQLKKYFYLMLFILIISVYALYSFRYGIEIVFFFTAMAGIAINTIVGLTDSWSLKIGDEIKANYGSMRAAGSFSLFISAIILGKLVTKCGYKALSIAII